MSSARKARSALEGMEGVKQVMADERLHEVSVVFEDQKTGGEALAKKLAEEGFFVEEAKK